ncbi:unnamed protein product [Rotaria magnacalcarata]|uniref:Uncharacterized protein n=1 Tax=Rotaria magnacalcarata TaxID=392030 RepID=A0A815X3T8_9BILA|nr:unnamed protein product [Rotaria magnacalcarata]CAF1552354.1 unnamed protein product [Rotaria magnacalcarata]CAF2228531.1 unnamed protein product [Rotaria magnacalcarata]CAF3777383.1 unnamed protein product [Rotaria magnacalcarata]CAF3835557.1 unnamed protein product [Rotaria magnacalcarata]
MFLLLLVFLINNLCYGLDLGTCRAPLGIQSGIISNSSFQASSSLDTSLGPHTARIRSTIEGGGWCPKTLIDSQSEEYLQINFINLTIITLIETQGRDGPFQEEYVDYYRLEYRRDPTHPWIKYRDFRKKEIFHGNSNNNIAEIREILQPIIAKQLRLYPIQSNDKQAKRMCLRLELYGCLSSDHLISYSIPQGDRRSYDMDFSDKTYDAHLSRPTNGLGQLIDGDIGSDDIRLDTQSWGSRGFEWVGWKKITKNRTFIPLKFYFDSVRNFSEIRIHTNNMFSKDIEQFRRINITTYLNEHFLENEEILIELSDDRQSEQARWINISLKGHLAKIIQIELTFGNANWMLISEIQFISNEISDMNLLTQLNAKRLINLNSSRTITVPIPFIIILASAISFVFIIFLICFIAIIFKQKKKRKLNRYGEKLILKTCHNDNNHNQLKLQIPCCNNIDKDTQSSNRSQSSYGAPSSSEPSTFSGTPKLSTRNKFLPSTTFHHPQSVKLLSTNGTDSDANFYASTDIVTVHNGTNDSSSTLRGVCGTSLMIRAITNLSQMIVPPRKVELISSETVPPGDLYGEGRFGQISIGNVHSCNRVVIRRLTKVSTMSRSLFSQESQLLCSIDHPNLANILYKTLDGLALVSEYTELGDLCLLMRRIVENDINARLDFPAMLFVTCQISGALSYLESRQLIHRDVSTRNCLVFNDYIIKLTDIAMASPIYSNYYSTEAHLPVRWMSPEVLLTGGNSYSVKSDVYSFGITLYEIMTTCRMLPFAHLSDQEIISSPPLIPNLDISFIDRMELKEILDLMFACLRRNQHERPTFQDIHRFLYQQQQSRSI